MLEQQLKKVNALHIHMSSINHGHFCMKILCSLFFFFYIFIFLKDSYALTYTHISTCRSTSTQDLMGNDSAMAYHDFENPIYQAEDEGEEDC